MALGRAPIVVGILAIAGGIAWFALRDSSRGLAPAPGGQGSLTGSGSGRAAISAPAGPRLGGSGSASGTASDPTLPVLADAGPTIDSASQRDLFTAQTRDAVWAARTEKELEDRLRMMAPTTVQSVECRADQCELLLGGSSDDVAGTIAKLEGPNGLSTVAKSLLLGGLERTGFQLTLRVYALFDRTTQR